LPYSHFVKNGQKINWGPDSPKIELNFNLDTRNFFSPHKKPTRPTQRFPRPKLVVILVVI